MDSDDQFYLTVSRDLLEERVGKIDDELWHSLKNDLVYCHHWLHAQVEEFLRRHTEG